MREKTWTVEQLMQALALIPEEHRQYPIFFDAPESSWRTINGLSGARDKDWDGVVLLQQD